MLLRFRFPLISLKRIQFFQELIFWQYLSWTLFHEIYCREGERERRGKWERERKGKERREGDKVKRERGREMCVIFLLHDMINANSLIWVHFPSPFFLQVKMMSREWVTPKERQKHCSKRERKDIWRTSLPPKLTPPPWTRHSSSESPWRWPWRCSTWLYFSTFMCSSF